MILTGLLTVTNAKILIRKVKHMKTLITLIAIFLGSASYAKETCQSKCTKSTKCCKPTNNNVNTNTIKVNVNNKGPRVVTNTKTEVRYVDRVVYRDKYVPIHNTKVIEKTKIVKVPVVKVKKVPVIKVRTKVKIKKKRVVRIKEAPRNTLNLLLGFSKTHIDNEKNGEYSTKLKTGHEEDLGLHYQHRLGSTFTLGGMVTVQENYYLTVGFGW